MAVTLGMSICLLWRPPLGPLADSHKLVGGPLEKAWGQRGPTKVSTREARALGHQQLLALTRLS